VLLHFDGKEIIFKVMENEMADNIWKYWKHIVSSVFCIVFLSSVAAQNLLIKHVAEFNGPVYTISDNGELKGYYFFYKNAIDEKTFSYNLKILTANLVETGNCKFEEGREFSITGSGTAGRNILLELTSYDKSTWKDLFIKIPSKKVFHVLFDMQGNVLYADSSYYATIKELKKSGLVMRMPFFSPEVFELPNSGLAFTTQNRVSGKTYNYSIKFFIYGNPVNNWEYHSNENHSDFNPVLIEGDSTKIYCTFSRIGSQSNKTENYLQALETSTGKIMFEKLLAYKNTILTPLKGFLVGENIEIVCRINPRGAGDIDDGNIYQATINSKGDFIKFDTLSVSVLNGIPGMPSSGKTFIRTMVRKADGTYVLIAEHSMDANYDAGFFTSVSHSMLNQELIKPMFDGIILINCNSSLDPFKISFLYWQPSSSFQFIKEPSWNNNNGKVEMSFIYHGTSDRDTHPTYEKLQYDTVITSSKPILKNLPSNKTTFYEGIQDYLLNSYYDSNSKMLHLTLMLPD
jgi:hypothetical protein